MITIRRQILLATIVLACAAGCVSGGSSQPNPTQAIAGRTFLSTGVTVDGVALPLVAGTRIRLTFENGRLGASVGCNTFGAAYRLDGTTLRIDGGSMTEMGCDKPRMDQDTWLFGILGAGPKVGLEAFGDHLTITSGTTVVTLLDRRVAEPDVSLAGRTWILESIISGQSASSVPAGITATIAFDGAGTVNVNDGCNTGSGRYALTAGGGTTSGGLTVTDLGMSKKACLDPAAGVESAILALLRDPSLRFEIEASQLRLRAGTTGLDFRS